MGKNALRGCLILVVLATGCTIIEKSTCETSLPGANGKHVMHVNATRYALNFGVTLPFLGDASIERAHDSLQEAAIAEGATQVHVVHSTATSYWYLLFPFSLLFTPVRSEVSANCVLSHPLEASAPGEHDHEG